MKLTQYKAKLDFGKCYVKGTDSLHKISVTVELRGTPVGPGTQAYNLESMKDLELSLTGEIWESSGRVVFSLGQNYEDLLEFAPTPLMYEIVGIWKRWHNNGLRAGDKAQEDYLRTYGHGKDYEETQAKLESAGLLVHAGYRYGSEWKFEALPKDIIKQVTNWEKSRELV